MDTIGIWPWKENNGPNAVAFPGQIGAREFSYEKRVPLGSLSFSLSIFEGTCRETVEGFLK